MLQIVDVVAVQVFQPVGLQPTVQPRGPTASYTGLDLNSAGVDSCRKRHQLPGLDFVQGNAEDLPFPDQSFDAVINIEASHCYPQVPRFLAEVARVLRPGGHFLYADARQGNGVAKWDEELGDAPMRLMSERVITEEVARAVEKNVPQLVKVMSRVTPAFFVDNLSGGSAADCRPERSLTGCTASPTVEAANGGYLIIVVASTPSDYTS